MDGLRKLSRQGINLSPFVKHPGNPIVKREDVRYPCNTVFNAGACMYDEEYILLLRVEDFAGKSHLTLAKSQNGVDFTVDEKPWITSSRDPYYEPYERYGVEDPRITPIDGAYYITYTAYGPYGVRTCIGRTKNFKQFERISFATDVDSKDGVLFPKKIAGSYVMIIRPGGMAGRRGDIWISYSPDMIHWGKSRLLLTSEDIRWSTEKLGAATPPLLTEYGWLFFYHGVRTTPSGRIYRVGAALLELEHPHVVIGRTPHFILAPEENYERIGDVPNVVFPCGAVVEKNGTIRMYYGVADTAIALATTHIDDIIKLCI